MPIILDRPAVAANGAANVDSLEGAQNQAQSSESSSLVEVVVAPGPAGLTRAANSDGVLGVASSTTGAAHAAGVRGTELGSPSAPELPYQQLARAEVPTGQQLVNVVSNLNLSDTEAYRILRQAGQKAFDLDSTIGRAANQAVLSAKLEQVEDLRGQIHGERKSATTQLAFSLLGAGAGITAGATGNILRGAAATPNAALDVDKRLASVTLGKTPDAATKDVLKEFHNAYASAARRATGAKPNKAANADPNKTAANAGNNPDPDSLDDLGHRQYARYRQQRQDAGENLSDNIKVAQDFFRLRQGDNSVPRLNERLKHARAGVSSIGAGLDGGAQGIQSSIAAAGTAYDKNSGGAYEADQAKLAGKQDEVQVSLAQQVADAAKSGRDRSLKQIADNLDAVKEAVGRYAAVIDKLT